MTATKRQATAKASDEDSLKPSSIPKAPKASVLPTTKRTAEALDRSLPETSPLEKHTKASPEIAKALDGGSPKASPAPKSVRSSTRKRRAKTLDENSPEASPTLKRAKASSDTSKKRVIAPRAAKVDRSDPFWLTTNEKSPLGDEDLYGELSNPKTYENFTKEDWDELRECFPAIVPLNPDGHSIPMDFFKYDADFRRGIREFQEDLSMGRLDPAWQEAAAEAMEERASGKFDAYKEDQFEEFWGQKQKLDYKAVAGESAKLKLDLMIQNGVLKKGDYFSYTRAVGRAKARVLVEKECEIVAVGSDSLTFAIPPGQQKYARPISESKFAAECNSKAEEPKKEGDVTETPAPNSHNADARNITNGIASSIRDEGQTPEESKTQDDSAAKVNAKDLKIDATTAKTNGKGVGETTSEIVEQSENDIHDGTTSEMRDLDKKAELARKTEATRTTEEPGIVDQKPSISTDLPHQNCTDAILHEITTLTQLEVKILEIDSRLDLSQVRASNNAWKALRGKRNNQDLGTLFEMREEFYVWKHPQIPKTPSGAYGS